MSNAMLHYLFTGLSIVLGVFVVFVIIPFVCYVISKAVTRGKLHAVRDSLQNKEKNCGKKDE